MAMRREASRIILLFSGNKVPFIVIEQCMYHVD
jgi:hypothetical protein